MLHASRLTVSDRNGCPSGMRTRLKVFHVTSTCFQVSETSSVRTVNASV